MGDCYERTVGGIRREDVPFYIVTIGVSIAISALFSMYLCRGFPS